MINIARENVRYLDALQRYWDPLYRCSPEKISNYLSSLITSLRNVYNTSRYYNTSDCMASFLVKTTNRLTLTCIEYLTDDGVSPIFQQVPVEFMQKVQVRFTNVLNKIYILLQLGCANSRSNSQSRLYYNSFCFCIFINSNRFN